MSNSTMPVVALRRVRVGRYERLAWFRDAWDQQEWDRSWWEAFDLPGALRLLEDCRSDHVQAGAMRRWLPRGGLILEAGCGLGQWMVILQEAGRAVIGADLSAVSLVKARAFFPGLRLVRADVTRLPFAGGSLSGYLSIGVLEHFRDGPAAALEEVARLLRPGGVLFCAVPAFNPVRALAVRASAPPPGLAFYQWAFTRDEFAGLLAAHGFTVVETVSFAALKTLRDTFSLPAPPGGAGGPVEGAGARRRARSFIKHRLLNAAPVRRLAGHMMAYVATRGTGRGAE